MKIIKDIPYEDGLVIAENYAMQEREIADLKKHIETIYELIDGTFYEGNAVSSEVDGLDKIREQLKKLSLNIKTKEQDDITK